MSPGNITIEPETSDAFRAGYKEGYEAGRSAIRRELKALLKTLKDKQLSTSTSSTYTNIDF